MCTQGFWEYDPTMDVWSRKLILGGAARLSAVEFVISDKVMSVGSAGLS